MLAWFLSVLHLNLFLGEQIFMLVEVEGLEKFGV